MVIYALKIMMFAIAAGTLAWAAIWLFRISLSLYQAKNYDLSTDDMDVYELAYYIDDAEEAISILRYHCNNLEMAIAACPWAALFVVPLYRLGKYTIAACERQAGCARRELMSRELMKTMEINHD